MSNSKFFRVESIGETLVFTATNSLGSLVEDDVREEWEALLNEFDVHQARNAVMDLGALDYFGSIMLELMVILWKRVSAKRGKMVVCNVSHVGNEILHTAKFHTIWPIVGSRDEALASIGS
ncbi:MAG: STAS domain-containing protein [Pirellulaceae bacterium]